MACDSTDPGNEPISVPRPQAKGSGEVPVAFKDNVRLLFESLPNQRGSEEARKNGTGPTACRPCHARPFPFVSPPPSAVASSSLILPLFVSALFDIPLLISPFLLL